MNKWLLTPNLFLILSTILTLNTNNWVLIWLMLEMNTLAFILNMSYEKTKEKLLMFFLFQAFSSMMMLIYLFFLNTSINQNSFKLMSYLVITAIFLKIGMFPFHSWMVKMSMNIYWLNISLLMTWQKIIPLMVLMKATSKVNSENMIIFFLIIMILIMMSLTSLKKILILSSLIHNSWMMMTMKFFKMIIIMYLSLYCLIILMVNMFFFKNNMKTTFYQVKEKSMKINMTMIMFSMMGIPPTMGFMMKLSVIFSMLKNKTPFKTPLLLTLASSLIFLVYVKIFFKILKTMKNNNKKKTQKNKNTNSLLMWLNVYTPMLMMH